MLRDVARDMMIRCAREEGVEPGLVIQMRRSRTAVRARDRAVALVKWSTSASLWEIARAFGFDDHSSVITAVSRHEARLNP